MLLTHKMAMESDKITAECIEATEFPDLATQYRVRAVPRTVVNDHVAIEGAMPEAMFIEQIMNAVSPASPPP